MKKLGITIAGLIALSISSIARARLGLECHGDDATPDSANVNRVKRSIYGITQNSLTQSVTVWCVLDAAPSLSKLRVDVYDRNPGDTGATNIFCTASNLRADGSPIFQENASSHNGGVGSTLQTISFANFQPGGNFGTVMSVMTCTLPVSVDSAWSSHLVTYYSAAP